MRLQTFTNSYKRLASHRLCLAGSYVQTADNMNITWDEVQKIRQDIEKTEGFSQDKTFLFDLVDQYKNVPREKTYELDDIFTNHADQQNWSRRKLVTLLHGIVFDIQKKDGYSDDIYDLLTNYLDGLEGNCIQATKLKGDKLDGRELTSYARSWEWWRQDFY